VPAGHGGKNGMIGKKNPDIMRPKIITTITSVFPILFQKMTSVKSLYGTIVQIHAINSAYPNTSMQINECGSKNILHTIF
jgi:hypothetical protein